MSAVTPPRSSLPNIPGRRFVPPRRDAPEVRRRFARRRLALAGGLLATTLAIAAALILIFNGSGEAPPDTGAAAIVPAGALAYVNLSTDPSRPAVGRARTLAARFPDWPILATAAQSRLDSIVGGPRPAGFTKDIRPWLGDEASLALVPARDGAAQSLVALEMSKPARARSFVTGAGAVAAGTYRGARLLAYPSGTELAFLGRYLVAGPAAAVRSSIDAWRAPARSLARDPAYSRAASSEPPDRVLDAYLPAAGIRGLVAPRTGVAGAIGLLLDRPSLQGAAISLSATSGGARVLMDTVDRAGASRSTAPSGASFTPTLQTVLPAGSTLMVDVPGLGRAAPALLGAAATAGIGANIGPLLGRLGSALAAEGVNVHSIVSLFSGETAVAISPGPTPALLIVARLRKAAAARSELASLEGPVSSLFSSTGADAIQVPELVDRQVGDATVHELQLGPGLQVNYTVTGGLFVLSTSVAAIDSVVQRSRSLADDASYKATLPDRPQAVSSLVFGDVSRLLALGEQIGLTSGAHTRRLLPDLARIRAIGVSSTSQGRDTTTELRLEIP
jgi:Protein of unknown function (DUF3352)